MGRSFVPFAEDFLSITGEVASCTVMTVDAAGSLRSHILRPIFKVVKKRPIGWAATARTPVKTAHLAADPHLTVVYWSPAQHTVVADCIACWVPDEAGKRHVWDLFAATPPPLGFPRAGPDMEDPTSLFFTPLRLAPGASRSSASRGGSTAPRWWRAAG